MSRAAARARRRRRLAAQRPRQSARPSGRDELALVAAAEPLTAGAQGGNFDLGARDETWDGGAAEKSYVLPADAACYMWKEAGGDPAQKGTYKLPFVSKSGGKHAVWGGITAIAGRLGNTDIPAADKAAVRTKLEGYYAKARAKYNDPSIKVPWGSGASADLLDEFEARLAYDPDQDGDDDSVPGGPGDTDGDAGTTNPNAEGHPVPDAHQPADTPAKGAGPGRKAPVMAALEQALDELDAAPETLQADNEVCDNCAHDMSMHEDGQGACTVPGCDCEAYVGGEVTDETGDGGQAAIAAAVDVVPDEHLPADQRPAMRPSPEAPATGVQANARQIRWEATLAPEGKLTDDRRAFAPGAIAWRDLPLSLMAMIETSAEGHEGAQLAGRIDRIWRDDATGLIRGAGVFDDGDYGVEIARLVDDRTLRGVSVDIAVKTFEVGPESEFFDEDGAWRTDALEAREAAGDDADEGPSLLDVLLGDEEPPIFVVTDGTIGAATVCPFPAFADAEIALSASAPNTWTVRLQGAFTLVESSGGAPADEGEALTASAALPARPVPALTASAAGLVPEEPPAAWFDDPSFDRLTALTVTDDGQVLGHLAPWDACHIGLPGCTVAPRSETGYAYFHLGSIRCAAADGPVDVECGQITLDAPHADRRLGIQDATAHYDHTGVAVCDVRAGEDEHGIWVAGALRPDADADAVRRLRGAKLSGDWRYVEGNLELVAALAVNVPGFPVPRARALVAAADDGPQVMALVAAGANFQADTADVLEREDVEELERLAAIARGEETDPGEVTATLEAAGVEVPASGPFPGRGVDVKALAVEALTRLAVPQHQRALEALADVARTEGEQALTASAIEAVRTLADRPPQPLHVHIPETNVAVAAPNVQVPVRVDLPAPEVTFAPEVNVDVPEQRPADVRVFVEQPVAPDVHVTVEPAAVQAPDVNVTVEAPPAPARPSAIRVEEAEDGTRRYVPED